VDNTGEVKDADMIGFRVKHDNGEELDFVYRKNGQSVVEAIANIQALAADTYIKLGFLLNPSAEPAKRIKLFVNGSELTTYITDTNIEAATFPAGEELSPICHIKNGTAAGSSLSLDWWIVGAERQ
jgi:hypothetical protein